jgi:hypothetical protein
MRDSIQRILLGLHIASMFVATCALGLQIVIAQLNSYALPLALAWYAAVFAVVFAVAGAVTGVASMTLRKGPSESITLAISTIVAVAFAILYCSGVIIV